MSGDNERPIIIKRKKVSGGDGHHGGAWKVAYADFVTAMMAFFMLMWLLNATTEKQRQGLADYFSPTVSVSLASGGGDGSLSGQSLSADSTMVQLGRGGITPSEVHGTTTEEATLEAVAAAVMGKGGESLLDEEELRHVAVRLTDEGLVIEFFALPDSPLFDESQPQPLLEELLSSVAGEIRSLPNALAIEVHTAAEPVVTAIPTGWPRSTSRANAVRRLLPGAGVADARLARVTGHADRRPFANDPTSVRNNRVEIIVLRNSTPPLQ